MRNLFSFLLLLLMIRILIGGAQNPAVIEGNKPEEVRSKLILDIIQTKKIRNPVFVATPDIEDEVLKPLAKLQDNNTDLLSPLILLDYNFLDGYLYQMLFRAHLFYDNYPYEYRYVEKIMHIMEQLVSQENKIFTYFHLPPFVSRDRHFKPKSRSFYKLLRNFDTNPLIGIILKESLDYHFDLTANEFLFQLREDDTVYDMDGFCYFCGTHFTGDYGFDTNVQLNNWAPLKGFRYPFNFTSSFHGNFYGVTLLINVQLHPSTIWLNDNGDYEGPLYEDLDTIGIILNFYLGINTVSMAECVEEIKGEDDSRRARELTEGAPDLKLLKAGKVDMVGGDYIATANAHKYADISAPIFYQEGAKIVSVEPRKILRWYAIFQPFTWFTWILIFLTIPICGLVLYLLRKYSKETDKMANYNDALFVFATIICWEPIKGSSQPLSVTLLFCAYMLGTGFLITGFVSEFTSLIVTPSHLSPPIDTLEDFWSSEKRWLGGRMTDYYSEYFESFPDVRNRLHLLRKDKRQLLNDEVSMAIKKMIRYPEDFVYFEKKGIMEWNICRYSLDMNGRQLYYSKDTLGDYNTHIYLQKNSIYTEIINRKILILQDMGIINHHQRRFANKEKSRECYIGQDAAKEDMIALRHLKPMFGILGAGYGTAFLYISPVLLNEVQCFIRAFPKMILNKLRSIMNRRFVLG